MIRTLMAASTLLIAVPAAAQTQEALDARYTRALAAGYKALMLCGAIANAERGGTNRAADNVVAWELTGVYAEIDPLVRTLDHRIVRAKEGPVSHVEVDWAPDMPPRFAKASATRGCRLAPIGTAPGPAETDLPPEVAARLVLPRAADGTPVFPPVMIRGFGDGTLNAELDRAFGEAYGKGTRTTGVVVRHKGTTRSARYVRAQDTGTGRYENMIGGFSSATPQRTWSVAKSIAATLVGVAVHKGQIDVNAPGVRAAWNDDARRAITVDHLLRMASGRYSDTPGNRTDPLYAGGSTVEETAADWPLIHTPGTVFRYANNDTLMAVKALSDRNPDFDPAGFFAMLGMRATVAETDWAGDYILSSQVWTTAEDLARFGQLYLDDGKLPDGTRILPEGWVTYVSTPSGPQPTNGTFGYGAGFWLLNREEGVPPDTFAAIGNRGQYVVIVPSRQVVIVRRGEDPAGSGFDIAAFTRDVLAALPTE